MICFWVLCIPFENGLPSLTTPEALHPQQLYLHQLALLFCKLAAVPAAQPLYEATRVIGAARDRMTGEQQHLTVQYSPTSENYMGESGGVQPVSESCTGILLLVLTTAAITVRSLVDDTSMDSASFPRRGSNSLRLSPLKSQIMVVVMLASCFES
jgi:hypothetical protein